MPPPVILEFREAKYPEPGATRASARRLVAPGSRICACGHSGMTMPMRNRAPRRERGARHAGTRDWERGSGFLLLDGVRLGRSGEAGALAVLAALGVPLHLGLLAVGLVGGRGRGRLGLGG